MPLTDDERREWAWNRLIGVNELLPAAIDSQMQRRHGLTNFEYLILSVLQNSEGGQSRMSEIASRALAAPSRVSHAVNRLEERNFITRSPSSSDRRETIATITAVGITALGRAAEDYAQLASDLVLDALSPEQLDQLLAIGDVILDRLDPAQRFDRNCSAFSTPSKSRN